MPELKDCPLCTRTFACANEPAGCWCERVDVPTLGLRALRAAGADGCVCQSCLDGFAAAPIGDHAIEARGVPRRWLAAGFVALLAAMAAGLILGPVSIPLGGLLRSLADQLPWVHVHSGLPAVSESILWQLRAPRVVLAAMVGGVLALSGSAYQGVFRNPLADPYLLGVAAGAGLGATLAIAYASSGGQPGLVVPLAAFGGAVGGVLAAYVLGNSVGGRTGGSLILAGVAVTAFLTAVQTFAQQQRAETLQAVYSWLLGSFGGASWHNVSLAAPYMGVSAALLLLHRRIVDVLAVGEDEATTLGVNVRRVRLIIVAAATAGTASAVAVSGLIGFVGIIIPHTMRLLVSTSYRAIIPLSLLFGAAFLVFADILARTVLSPAELPIGVITAFFGAPFFAIVLRRSREQQL